MLMTFRTGLQALSALNYDKKQVNGSTIHVGLQRPNWEKHIEEELGLLRNNTVALYTATTNALLGEDFSGQIMSFDIEG